MKCDILSGINVEECVEARKSTSGHMSDVRVPLATSRYSQNLDIPKIFVFGDNSV